MKNVLIAMLVIGGITFLVLLLNPMMGGLHDFRTNSLSNNYSVTTAVATTGTNVTLTHGLFNGDTQYASATSNLTTDVSLVNSYVVATKSLEVTGLTANTSRTLTVTYDTAVLDGNVEAAVNLGPTIFVFGIIALIILSIAVAVIGLRR